MFDCVDGNTTVIHRRASASCNFILRPDRIAEEFVLRSCNVQLLRRYRCPTINRHVLIALPASRLRRNGKET
jgi:hypothetical protein